MKRVRSRDDWQGSSVTYLSHQDITPPLPLQEGRRCICFSLIHFKQKNESASWQIRNPVYSQTSVPAGAFSRRAREGGQLHHHTNSHLAQAVKYGCGKCFKCMLAMQQTRMAQLERWRVITILVTLVLLTQITSPSLAPGPESSCMLLCCKFSSPRSVIRSE